MNNWICRLNLFVVLFFSCTLLGWIDPLADKIREGNILYNKGKYDEALERYVTAQVDSQGMPELDFNIANVQYKRDKYDEALQLFEKGIKSENPEMRVKACFNLGNTLYRQNKMKEALDCYKKVIDYVEEIENKDTKNLETLKNDARYNHEFIEKKMQEQEQQQQSQNQKDQQQKEESKKDDKQSEENKGEDKQESQKDKKQSESEETGQENKDRRDKATNQTEEGKQENQPLDQQKQLQAHGQRQMSREEAERLLNALNQSEKQSRGMVSDKQRVQHKSVEKDW